MIAITHRFLNENGVEGTRLYKVAEEKRPNVLDAMKNGDIGFIINTPSGPESREDEIMIRSGAVANKISICTNLAAAKQSVMAIQSLQKQDLTVTPLQDYHGI